MRSTVVTLIVAASAALAAQQTSSPTFRASVTLVPIDVTVLDKDGRPVSGLNADDFQIKLNGKLQPVRTLSYVRAEPAEAATAPPVAEIAGRPVVTNAVGSKDPKIIVLAIDDLSFPPEGARRTLFAAQDFVQKQGAGVLLGLTTTSGQAAVNPTPDHTSIVTALKHVSGSFIDPRRQSSPDAPAVGITEAMEIADHNNSSVLRTVITRECPRTVSDNGAPLSSAINDYSTKCATDVQTEARFIATLVQGTTNRQIASLSNALTAMKGAPGLKQMIVVSQGVATTRNFLTLYEPVTKSAAAAGVQLSFLMDDDDDLDMQSQDKAVNGVGQPVHGNAAPTTRREDRRMFIAAMQVFADATGGTFERVVTNPSGALTRAALAGSAVYRLGVEAPPDASVSKPLDVVASVTRDGLTLHANHIAVLPAAIAPESAAERVAAAIKHGKPYYAVPIRVAVSRRRAEGNQVELGLGISVPRSVAGPLHLTIGVMDAAGGLKQGTRVVPLPDEHGDYRLTVPMPVAPGQYRVRLAVEDATGAVGSVESQVDAGLAPMGAFRASDLLTWSKDASGQPQFLALDELPAGLTNLSAGLELYRSAGVPAPADVTVTLALFAVGATEPMAEIAVTPRLEGDVLRAQSSLPLASLPSGAYTIRATVSVGAERLGSVAATIRKG